MDQCKGCLFERNKNDLISCQCAILKYNWRELWRTVIPVLRIDPYECPHKLRDIQGKTTKLISTLGCVRNIKSSHLSISVAKTQKGMTHMKTQKVTKKRTERPECEKPRFCDPAACFHCQHIDNGTFVCNKDAMNPLGVVVVSEWEATEKYLHCKRNNNHRRERR